MPKASHEASGWAPFENIFRLQEFLLHSPRLFGTFKFLLLFFSTRLGSMLFPTKGPFPATSIVRV